MVVVERSGCPHHRVSFVKCGMEGGSYLPLCCALSDGNLRKSCKKTMIALGGSLPVLGWGLSFCLGTH